MEPAALSPFTFIGCSELQESLGQQADDEKELAEMLEEVPLDSVHFHTHSYFLRHRFIERVYPNDFAQWVVTQVGDHILGEKLAVVDPFEPPMPAKVSLDQAARFAESLARGEPNRGKIALTVLSDKVRELI